MFWEIIFLALLPNMDSTYVGTIKNNIMLGVANISLLNITRAQCICRMLLSNQTLLALNYFPMNHTCQLFNGNMSSVVMQLHSNASFVFVNQSITLIRSNGKLNSIFCL